MSAETITNDMYKSYCYCYFIDLVNRCIEIPYKIIKSLPLTSILSSSVVTTKKSKYEYSVCMGCAYIECHSLVLALSNETEDDIGGLNFKYGTFARLRDVFHEHGYDVTMCRFRKCVKFVRFWQNATPMSLRITKLSSYCIDENDSDIFLTNTDLDFFVSHLTKSLHIHERAVMILDHRKFNDDDDDDGKDRTTSLSALCLKRLNDISQLPCFGNSYKLSPKHGNCITITWKPLNYMFFNDEISDSISQSQRKRRRSEKRSNTATTIMNYLVKIFRQNDIDYDMSNDNSSILLSKSNTVKRINAKNECT